MSSRTLLILFVVLVVVAGIAYLVSRQGDSVEAEPTATVAPIPDTRQFLEGVEMAAVGRLEITDESAGLSAIYFREPEGVWFQTQPTQTLVISQTLNSNMSGLLNLTSRRTLAPDENPLSAYGLENPGRSIILVVSREDGNEVRHTFFIGNETPAGNGYYLQKQGLPDIYIVPTFTIDNLFAMLTEPPVATPVPPVTNTVPITGTVPITP